ncbi:N-6 DNA methylase [Methylobacterium sp. SI9]|uniref:class I SAM-dependent DNA methyltransferase n=1 Tax=Methylobacterium guangdongense TaxID=3138811 RepID=UPI00313D0B0D
MLTESHIVQKLWGLCHFLRDEGITYHEYVNELTLLLFLKMVSERRAHGAIEPLREGKLKLPKGCSWEDLRRKTETDIIGAYTTILEKLGRSESVYIRAVFSGTTTSIRSGKALIAIMDGFDDADWYHADVDQFGAAYEGLLQRSAEESKAGAGQYFTPRPLIDCIIQVVQPKHTELVQDPAAGSAGFLVAADAFIKNQTEFHRRLSPPERQFQEERAFCGLELVPDTCRLGRMNMLLHGIGGALSVGDALKADGQDLDRADVIITNPPFGTRRSGLPNRTDLPVRTNNKQLNFLQHAIVSLSDRGRAAIVLPDNVLFENGAGTQIRRLLMHHCRLHTILRLPTGIFYAPDVKTHVLFFCRDPDAHTDSDATSEVWLYDLRSGIGRFSKRSPLDRSLFEGFLRAFGTDPYGRSKRLDGDAGGRFQRFTRQEIADMGDTLNLPIRQIGPADELEAANSLQLVEGIAEQLEDALARIRAIQDLIRISGSRHAQ